MNSKERVLIALHGGKPHRLPVTADQILIFAHFVQRYLVPDLTLGAID